MATQIKATKKDSPAIRLGKARDNKPADDYATPHTMSGKKITGEEVMKKGVYATDKTVNTAELKDPVPNGVSFAITRSDKTDGVTMRGYGAATKGIKSRGPMA
jgi:hypothetical protein